MVKLLKDRFDSRSKKLNKIEKIKALQTPTQALDNLQNQQLSDEDKSFFLKCFGCFYKEKTDDYMIRVRVVGGKLTPLQAKIIANIAIEFGDNYIDFTTRMQIELRYIKQEHLYKVLLLLEDAGITTYQTGVDNFRGVLIDPLSGYSRGSILNERRLTKDIESIFLKVESELSALPRKFNIGLCGNIRNSSNVFGQDLGFALSKRDGEYGFRVFMGGKVGVIARDSEIFVNEKEAIILFRGVKELFKTYGYRDNRNKNRFYFLLQDVGLKNFVKALEEYCDYEFKKGGEVLTQIKVENSLIEELSSGKKAYKFIIPAGIFSGSDMLEASDLAKESDGFISLTYDQSFYIVETNDTIINSNLYNKYKPTTYKNNLIACAGTKTCSFALIKNKDDAINLANELKLLVPLNAEIKFHWSGCIKGCGIHGVGDFGFVGAKLKVGGIMREAVDIYFGGNSKKEGKKILKVELTKLSSYIKPILEFYKQNRLNNESFEEFIKNSAYSIWAYAFIMKVNAVGFDFIPNKNSKANKIEFFEIKEIANQISYQLTKHHSIDNIFTPLEVKSLKKQGYKEPIYTIFDNMLQGKYRVWSEILMELKDE